MRCCDSCNLVLPCKSIKKMKGSILQTEIICKHCAKVHKKRLILEYLFFWLSIIVFYMELIFPLAVKEVETMLWHMQEYLAPFRWWELGEIICCFKLSIMVEAAFFIKQ